MSVKLKPNVDGITGELYLDSTIALKFTASGVTVPGTLAVAGLLTQNAGYGIIKDSGAYSAGASGAQLYLQGLDSTSASVSLGAISAIAKASRCSDLAFYVQGSSGSPIEAMRLSGNTTAAGTSLILQGGLVPLGATATASGYGPYSVGQTATMANAVSAADTVFLVSVTYDGSVEAGLYLVTYTGGTRTITALVACAGCTVAVNGSNQITVTNTSGGNRTIICSALRLQ